MALVFGVLAPVVSNAAPIPGFEAEYQANFVACTLPDGSPEACALAMQAYVDALVAAGIGLEEANASFSALRQEIFAANASTLAFQTAISGLFEQLLPDSGAIGGVPASPA